MRLVKLLSRGEGIRTLLWTFVKSFQVSFSEWQSKGSEACISLIAESASLLRFHYLKNYDACLRSYYPLFIEIINTTRKRFCVELLVLLIAVAQLGIHTSWAKITYSKTEDWIVLVIFFNIGTSVCGAVDSDALLYLRRDRHANVWQNRPPQSRQCNHRKCEFSDFSPGRLNSLPLSNRWSLAGHNVQLCWW